MSSEFLPVFRQNTAIDLKECIPKIASGSFSYRELLTICRYYRWQGLLGFLDDTNRRALSENLAKGAQMFAFGLGQLDDATKVLSKGAPLFDALAVRAISIARQIVQHSDRQHKAGKEYAEDFLYTEFLIELFLGGADDGTLESLLDRYDAALNGAADRRVDLCRALFAKDQKMFDDSFSDLLSQYKDSYDARLQKGALGDEQYYSEGKLWVEGMALLVIAEDRGLKTAPEYPLIPDMARPTADTELPPEAWKSP